MDSGNVEGGGENENIDLNDAPKLNGDEVKLEVVVKKMMFLLSHSFFKEERR